MCSVGAPYNQFRVLDVVPSCLLYKNGEEGKETVAKDVLMVGEVGSFG